MSPVSRGRKPKKSKKRGRTHRSSPVEVGRWPAVPLAAAAQPPRPAWFDPAIKTVIDGAGSLDAASGPRELEQRTAELLGAELHRILQEEHEGLRFDRWFEDLVGEAAARVVEQADVSAFRLLHGLTAIGTPVLASMASAACRRTRKVLTNAGDLPEWLDDLFAVAATGEVFRMRDAYGTRFAVLAGFSYGHGRDPSVFLFDIDASGIVRLAGAGVFPDVARAAAAWLAALGDAAGETAPQPVVNPRELLCLQHCDAGGEMIMGDESRVVMDNWFRAQRRHHDLAEALRRRGKALPAALSLYHDLDVSPMTDEFTTWYTAKHGFGPDAEALAELAAEWLEGSLPETWYAVSPARVRFLRGLMSDWEPDDPITLGVKSLLPDWVTWLAERAGLPAHLRAHVYAATR